MSTFTVRPTMADDVKVGDTIWATDDSGWFKVDRIRHDDAWAEYTFARANRSTCAIDDESRVLVLVEGVVASGEEGRRDA